jgi:hypothetical protein
MTPRLILRADVPGRRLRASPFYQIVRFDALTPEQARPLTFLMESNPHLEALFLPRVPGLSVKVAGSKAVSLVRDLGSEGTVRVGVLSSTVDVGTIQIARLVFDQILEVETESGWRSGAGAIDVFIAELPTIETDSATAEVSIAAIRYAQSLSVDSPAVLADRLYGYNRKPVTPSTRRSFPDESSVALRLGLDAEWNAPVLSKGLMSEVRPIHADHWLRWQVRGNRRRAASTGAAYKLYISPEVGGLRSALEAAFALFDEEFAPYALKVGRALEGILRSDKLVAYFHDEGHVTEAAAQLLPRLDGLVPQPVPFTTEIGGDGLLSRGIDPPHARQLPGWRHGEASWRAWITTRLGSAILAARSADRPAIDSVRFVLARLALEGVDTRTWEPARRGWTTPAGRA